MQAEGVTTIDHLVITHPDSDHAGGCDEVLEAFDVLAGWEPGIAKDTNTWQDCRAAMLAEGAPIYNDAVLDPGMYLDWSNTALVHLLHINASRAIVTRTFNGTYILEAHALV